MKNARSSILNRIPIILMGWMALLAACAEKDLVYGGEEVDVKVDFDWEDAIEAKPEGMTLIFFPADSSSMSWRFDIPGHDGGEIKMLSGVYNILAFNNDLPGVEFTNTDSYELFSAGARSVSDSLTSPTGMLYSATLREVALFPSDGKTQFIRLKPASLSSVYHISLDSVSGMQRIKTATAILRGVARSVCLCVQRNSVDTCCMSMPLHIAPDRHDRLEAVAAGFGNPDVTDPGFYLDVIVTTSHARYSKTFDVTEQIVNSRHPKDVYINIKGLDIPAADTPADPDGGHDVGISVGVDGWQLIEIIYS